MSNYSFMLLWEKFDSFMRRYPEVKLELTSDMKFTDIITGRFNAGIRLGESLEQDR
ncbi:Putative DNA-binding transcriptional regulator [Avibacterium paragallinarum JF4211]|nr:Putative DNA-binding transcriptional regulator [Avibacterium paragallinarum JF4211]